MTAPLRRSHRRRSLVGLLAMTLAADAVALTACSGSGSTVRPRHLASAPRAGCETPGAASRAARALAGAKHRYAIESTGATIHADLRQIAGDRVLLRALFVGDLTGALAEADRQLVRHVVRIRVFRGSRILLDANSTSFDVAGAGMVLRAPTGRPLGRLQITVQDFIGFVKLVHKLNAQVVVRGAWGHVQSSLAPGAVRSLPASGCVKIGSRSFVVHSFDQTSFSGEPVTISLLTPA